MPEELAHQAFGPVPPDRPSDSARRDDSQPAPVQTVRKREQNQVAALDADTLPLHAEELPPSSNPVAPGKIPVHVSPAAAITRLGACGRSSTKRTAACAPWPGAVSGLPCRSSCSFACETRASACGADCWADTCASCSLSSRPVSASTPDTKRRIVLTRRAGCQRLSERSLPRFTSRFPVVVARRLWYIFVVPTAKQPPPTERFSTACGKNCGNRGAAALPRGTVRILERPFESSAGNSSLHVDLNPRDPAASTGRSRSTAPRCRATSGLSFWRASRPR